MRVRMFGFRDRVAQAFIGDAAGLLLFKSNVVAVRQFADLCRQEGSMFARHPGDYELVAIGEFDTETGDVEPFVGGPAVICTAADVLTPKEA